jgi:hypothetical protein
VTAYFISQAFSNQNKYLSSGTIADIDLYKSMRKSSCVYAGISAVPTLLFTGGSIILFRKHASVGSKEQQVSVKPFVGECSGVVVTIKF